MKDTEEQFGRRFLEKLPRNIALVVQIFGRLKQNQLTFENKKMNFQLSVYPVLNC